MQSTESCALAHLVSDELLGVGEIFSPPQLICKNPVSSAFYPHKHENIHLNIHPLSQKDLHRSELQNLQTLFLEQKALLEKTIADARNHRPSFDAKIVMEVSTQTNISNLMANHMLDANDRKVAHECMCLDNASLDSAHQQVILRQCNSFEVTNSSITHNTKYNVLWQDKDAAIVASHLQEMRDQKIIFEERLAQSSQSALDQRVKLEELLAQAAEDTNHMRDVYEEGARLASDDAEEKMRASMEVCMHAYLYSILVAYMIPRIKYLCSWFPDNFSEQNSFIVPLHDFVSHCITKVLSRLRSCEVILSDMLPSRVVS